MRCSSAAMLVYLCLAPAACTDTNIDEVPLTVGDAVAYTSDVQTYVGYRCASLDCHGDMGRTLRLYAERGLRLEDVLRDRPLTGNEIGENLLSIAAFDSLDAPVEENQILLKALAVSAGGMAHIGGAVWPDADDPGYRCVAAWLSGTSEENQARAACTAATDDVLPEE